MIRRLVSMTGIADKSSPRPGGGGERPAILALVCLLLFAFFFSPAATASFQLQSGSTPPNTDEPAIYRLQGTVVNSVTGEPIYRAMVTVNAQQPRAVLTDREGRFLIEGLPRLQTAVTAQKPGYFDGQNWQRSGQPLIEIGPSSVPVLLKLIPEALITGHVTDENGEPLGGITVRLSSFHVVNGRKQWQQGGGAATNEDGEYRIANLQRGEYYISAGPARTRTPLQVGVPSADPAYPLTYYPEASELTGSSPIQLLPGDHAQADFSLKPVRSFLISGTVTGAPDGLHTNLTFMNPSGDDPASARVFNPRNGRFEARIAGEGPCTIKARSQGAGNDLLLGETTINVTSDVKGIVVNMAPMSDIPVDFQQQKVASAPKRTDVFVTSTRLSGFPGNIQVTPLDGRRSFASGYAQTRGPQDPSLHIPNLEPGSYQVTAEAYQPWYVYSLTSGTSDLLREPFVVTPGDAQPIQVVVRDDSGSLQVKVHLTGDQQRAWVLMIPERAPLHLKTTFVGQQGTLTASVAPGDYKVLAFDSIDELEYTNPEVMRPYFAKAASVSVLPEQKASVDVELIRMQQP